MLFKTGWGRFISPLWVATGLMHVNELVTAGRNWGPISAYTLFGFSLLPTGAYVLWVVGQEATVHRRLLAS